MRILCLCPTYNHASLLPNTLACFEAQTYKNRYLLILDDAGQIMPQSGDRWRIESVPARYPSLPAKYSVMLAIAGDDWDAIAVWDDDDVYLPWHLAAAAEAISAGPARATGSASAKPATILSSYSHELHCRSCGARVQNWPTWEPGQCRSCRSYLTHSYPIRESGAGRFHGSLVISRAAIERIGGWIQTRRADFDQQQLAAVASCGPMADMVAHSPGNVPSYVYRWQTTNASHCSGLMRSPDNEDWYDRHAAAGALPTIGQIVPSRDAETAYLTQLLSDCSAAQDVDRQRSAR